jgi:hypothetical protein
MTHAHIHLQLIAVYLMPGHTAVKLSGPAHLPHVSYQTRREFFYYGQVVNIFIDCQANSASVIQESLWHDDGLSKARRLNRSGPQGAAQAGAPGVSMTQDETMC